MQRRKLVQLALGGAAACSIPGLARAQASPASPGSALSYTNAIRGFAPTPSAERDLPTVVAEPYFKVDDRALSLEGASFDRQGNLIFVDIGGGRVLKLTPNRELSTIYSVRGLSPAGVAIHKDGRIFLAGLGPFEGGRTTAGSIVAINPDGTNPQVIVPQSAGHVLDDIVFDNEGGFYVTDFGRSTAPVGGVFYVTPDYKTIKPVLPNLSVPNGVALSPDSKVLWATEYSGNRLHRVDLASPGVPAQYGASVPYHFVGRSPDSMRTDSAGNAYVAMFFQGRILVFSPYGVPIAQVLMPGREENRFLKAPTLAIKPGSRDMLILARDDLHGGGSMVFSAKALTDGFPMFSHT